MLGRAETQAPDGSPLRADLREIGEIAQTALDNVRGLSQTLHPSILEELGLESTIDWYLSTVEKQLGLVGDLRARRARPCRSTPRSASTSTACCRRRSATSRGTRAPTGRGCGCAIVPASLELEVEDHGVGLGARDRRAAGLGLVAMRERAELVGGTLDVPAAAERRHARAALTVPV